MKNQLKNLVSELVRYGQIETTLHRAKRLKGKIDELIVSVKEKSLPSRRRAVAMLGDKKLANKLVDEIVPSFGIRQSGFTRIYKLGARRGDRAEIARIEFVESIAPAEKKTSQKGRLEQKVKEKIKT